MKPVARVGAFQAWAVLWEFLELGGSAQTFSSGLRLLRLLSIRRMRQRRGEDIMSKGLATFMILSALLPCSVGNAQVKPPTQTERKIADLQQQVAQLKQALARLDSNVDGLWREVLQAKAKLDAYRAVQLDLASPHKFQRIDSGTGSFLLSVEDAIAYLDGYKIRLNIGNPSAARYDGFKLKVKWSKGYDFSNFEAVSYLQWQKAIREKEVSFTEALQPGTWNRVEMILSPAGADELGYLEVSLDTETVSLIKPM